METPLLISALTPGIIILYLIYRKDTEKEPWKLLFKCFMGGVFCVLPAINFSTLFSHIAPFDSPALSSFWNAFVVAGFVEEFSKLSLLYIIVWRSKEFDQYYDGIVYAVFVSMGFAIVENVMYVAENGYINALCRGVLSVPGHCFFAVIMGYFFSMAKFNHHSKRKYLLLSLFAPTVAHGFYNFWLMYVSAKEFSLPILATILLIFTIFIILLWRYGFMRIKEYVAIDKANSPL